MKRILLLDENHHTRFRMESLILNIYVDANIYVAENVEQSKEIVWRESVNLDIAIFDVYLPDGNGITLLKWIKSYSENTYCIIFTISEDEDLILKAFLSGADGFLSKNSSDDQLVLSITHIESGIPAVSPSVTKKLIRLIQNQIGVRQPELLNTLTPREKDVLLLLSKGYRKREVGYLLKLSENTVKDHTKSLYTKLNIANIAEATIIAINSGLITQSPKTKP